MGLKPPGVRGSVRNVSVGALAIPDSGLEHHYVASDFDVNDGDAVGTWTDKEGSADLSATGNPTLQTGEINGEPVVRYDGTDDRHTGSFSTTLSQPTQIYLVGRLRSIATSGVRPYLLDGASNNEQVLQQDVDGSQPWRLFAGTMLSDGDSDTNDHIFNALFNGGSSEFRLDGGSQASGDAGTNSLSGLSVAARQDDAQFAPLDVAEILVYGTEQSASDEDQTEQYLADKYGITLA